MERQLVLLDVQPDWRLDEHTREIGRVGIRQARDALRDARCRAAGEAVGIAPEPSRGDRHAA